MKKLLLFLILFFFSIQSYANSCPDGSDPVRSISADGTYFVFNCSSNSENASQSNNSASTEEKTQIEWVDGLYAKSITDEFNVLSKDFSKSVESGGSMITPLGSGDFSGDGMPEIVYGIQYWDLKKGSHIKPIFLTKTPGKGFSLFRPIMDIVPYTCNARSSVIEDFNGDGVNDIFIADTGVDYDPFPGCQNSLILSAPNGKFINATSNLPQILDFTHGVTSGDVDSDGDIDLFVTQAGIDVNVPHYFLRNNGKGRFTKIPDGQLLDRGLSYISWKPGNKRRNIFYTPGLEFVDDDDKLDLILLSGKLEGVDNNRIIFGSNSGFKKSDALELQPGRFGRKSAGYNYLVTDIDNDGDNDILILHVTINLLIERSHLGIDLQVLIQENNRKFVDKSNFYFPGITFDYGTWNKSLNLIDINNDDKNDIVLVSGNGIDDPSKQQIGSQIKTSPPKVLIRQEDGSFRPLNNDLLTGGEKNTLAGIRPIDIDNDGDIEFVVHKGSEKGFTLQVLELTTNKDESTLESFRPTHSNRSSDTVLSSPLFDGRYSFTISRFNENDGSQRLGNGYIEINNGIMTVAKEGRTLDKRIGSIDLYDSFKGQIDKEGNIISSLKINVLTGKTHLFLVDLNGSIDSPLQGEWDHYFDVILKLDKKE
ncbi:FG-GAP repeat domain-containing protein [Pseudothioglobus sp. nBUS_23]|uniref:FG-GAP repeat domain-containing protein n=1 Tax=Pseudothioglobus sp. nBUS_23 TaxID=3395318 RepID=UPI003EB827AA